MARVLLVALSLCAVVLGFECDDGQVVVDDGWVNDNYCDCRDGSDELETSGCSGRDTQFQCASGDTIWSSFLEDGVCDCCDGSDEPGMDCPNTCKADLERQIQESTRERDDHDKGFRAIKKWRRLKTRARRIRDRMAKHEGLAMEKISQLEKSMRMIQTEPVAGKSSREIFERFRKEHEAHAYYTHVLESAKRWRLTEFGPNNRFLPLLAMPCIKSRVLCEKVTKGGSITVVPKLYRYRVCLFRNVTQSEVNPKHWQDAEDAADESMIDVQHNGATNVNEEEGSPGLLGVWHGWSAAVKGGATFHPFHLPPDANSTLPKHQDPEELVMHYRNGESCGGSRVPNATRTVTVNLRCDRVPKVIRVSEDGDCTYVLTVGLPHVCSEARKDTAQERINGLQAKLASISENDRENSEENGLSGVGMD